MPYKRQAKGEAILASTINDPIAGLERQERAASGPGLRVGSFAGVPVHQADVDGTFFARLTSTTADTGRYLFAEVTPNPSGAWDAMTNGRTGSAWEFNLAAGLTVGATTGKVVRVRWFGEAGEYRFLFGACTT